MKTFYDSISNRANKLMNIAIELNSCYQVYNLLRVYQYEENDFINLSPAFFQIVNRALIYELFIESSKLFDKYDKDESIYRLLIDCENGIIELANVDKPFESIHFWDFNDREGKIIYYKGISDMIIKNKNKIEQERNIINSITKQRNKIYAHYDKEIVIDQEKFLKKFSVNLLDFKTVLLLYSNICNDFMNLLFNKTVYPFTINAQDLSNIIYYTKQGNNKKFP